MSRILTRPITVVLCGILLGCATTRYEEYGETDEASPEAEERPLASPVILAARRDTMAQIQSRIDRLEEDLSMRLAGVEAGQGDLATQLMSMAEQLESICRQLRAMTEGAGVVPTPKKTAGPPPRVTTPGDPSKSYEEGHRLYQRRSYLEASRSFVSARQSDPNGDLADNAQYWIGECEYAQRKFTTAVEAFQKVFHYPETEKDDDAQLKLGLCYLELGDRERALVELKRLVVDYPKSEYLGRAEELIEKIRLEGALGP